VGAERRAEVFSVQTALLSLAAFAGSLLGGALPPAFAALTGASLDSPAPYRYALMVGGLAFLPAVLAVQALRPAPAAREEDTPAAVGVGAGAAGSILGLLMLIALVRLLQVGGIGATTTFFNIYLDGELLVPTAQIGAIIAAGRLLGVPAALATSTLTRRYGSRAVVIGVSIGSALSILPIALVPHWAAAGLGFVGLVGLSWIRYAASVVFFMELVPPSRRAIVSGVTEMAGGLCFTALTFGGGYMIALLGYRSLFLTGAALTALSALAFWLAFRAVRPASF
jgi:predicted MFS family arabinose efflux permease